jgi:hypothetical protein
MHTQFDGNPDTKTLPVDGRPEPAAIDFEQTPNTWGGDEEGFAAVDSETRDGSGKGEGDLSEVVPHPTQSVNDTADEGPVATEASEPQGRRGPDLAFPTSYSDVDKLTADEEQAVPRFFKQELAALLDESTGNLVSLEDFEGEVDVEFYRRYWFGSHLEDSLLAIEDEHRRKGKCVFHVDRAGKLLDDPDKFLLAVKNGVAITLCVHRGQNDDQNIAHILRPQFCNRVLTTEERRKLRNEWIEVQLRLGVDYETIANMAGVCPNTVRNVEARAAADSHPNSGFTKRPDRRFKPSTRNNIAEAGRLRAEGKDNSEIAALLGEKVETVNKWLKDPPAQGNTKDKKQLGKKPKTSRATSAAQPTEMTDTIAANEGIPRIDRLVLERTGQGTQAYIEWLEAADAKARADINGTADNLEELGPLYLYSKQLKATLDIRLRKILYTGGEVHVEEGTTGDSYPDGAGSVADPILLGIVTEIKPDEAFVALVNGSSGLIANRDNGFASKGSLVQGQIVRVRVEEFNSERGFANLRLMGRQSFSQADCANAFTPRLNDLCSPDTELAGLKVGHKEEGVAE